MPTDTNLFSGVYSMLPPPTHKAHSYIQTTWGEEERGSSKGERDKNRGQGDESRAPSTPPGRASGDHPSIQATANELGFQELAAALTPITHPCYCKMLVTRLKR